MNNTNNPFESGKNNSNNNPFENKKKKNESFKYNNEYTSNTNNDNTSPNNNAPKIKHPESNKSTQQSSTVSTQTSNGNNSSNAAQIIVFIIVICGIGYSLFWTAMFEKEETYYYEETIAEIPTLDIVEGYEYNFDDLGLETTNPFPNPIPKGENYTIENSDERGYDDGEYYVVPVEVGKDIQPGIYTIVDEGTTDMDISLQMNTYFSFNEGVEYYNIPLVEGDIIDLYFPYNEKNENAKVDFTAQSEYVNFEPGLNGVFVYGLNQYNSELTFELGEYSNIVYSYIDPVLGTAYNYVAIYDDEITLPGNPGSYFAIEY